MDDVEKRNAKYLEDYDKVSEGLTEIKDQYKLRFKSLRIDYARRLRDHVKELQYWRDTIRKLLYEHNIGADRLFHSITSSLKTYSVNYKSNLDFELEELLASTNFRNEKKKSKDST